MKINCILVFICALFLNLYVLRGAEEYKNQQTPPENQKISQLSNRDLNARRLSGWAPMETPVGVPEGSVITSIFFLPNGEIITVLQGSKESMGRIGHYDGKNWSYKDIVCQTMPPGDSPKVNGVSPAGVIYATGSSGQKGRARLYSSMDYGTFQMIEPGLVFQMLGGFVFKDNKTYAGTSWTPGIPVFVSNDGQRFERTSPAENWPHQNNPGAAYAFKMHPVTGDFYVSTEGDGVWTSADDGKTWKRLDIPYLPDLNMFDLDFSVKGSLFVATMGHKQEAPPGSAEGVYRYKDGKWTHSFKDLPMGRGIASVCARSNTGVIYTGTDHGVYQSLDDGDTWEPNPINIGLRPFKHKVQDGEKEGMAVNVLKLGPDGHLYANVIGTGIHRSTTPVEIRPPTITTQPWIEPKVVALPALATVDIVASDLDPMPLTYTWTKVSGPGQVTFIPKEASPSAQTITFGAPGSYALRVTVSNGHLSTSADLNVDIKPATSPGPEIDFTMTSSGGSETSGKANLEVSLKSTVTKKVTVDYEVVGGTATKDIDYELAKGTLIFEPGKTSSTISLIIKDDKMNEANETIEIALSNPAEAHLGYNVVNTYTITDDDAVPAISFETASSSGNEMVKAIELKVKLEAPSGQEVAVDYTVSGGTASGNGVDYVLKDGKLTFKPSEISQIIPLAVVLDGLNEPDETVEVSLKNPVNATLGTTSVHTCTIQNVSVPMVAFGNSIFKGSEAVTAANLTVVLSVASKEEIKVDYGVKGGTATGDGVDYTLIPGTLVFKPGEVSKSIPFTIVNDKLDEDDEERIDVVLSNPINAVLGEVAKCAYKIMDDDPPPLISFQAASSSSPIGKKPQVNVVISVPTGKVASATCRVTGGTAMANYKGYNAQVKLSGSEKRTKLEFAISKNSKSGQTVEFTLSDPKQCTLGTTTKHVFTIE